MGWKEVIVANDESIGDADTGYTCQLPKAPITSIKVRIHGTGGAGTVALAYTMVTKVVIETDTTNKRLVDLSSAQLARRQNLLFGTTPACISADSAYSHIAFSIFAGHKIRDRACMFPLHLANKRELQLTFDADLIDAARLATTTIKAMVTAVIWEGALPKEYMGFLSQQQELSQATATGDLDYKNMSLPPKGEYIDLDITVSAITTVDLIHWTGVKEIGGDEDIYKKALRDVIESNNYERDLASALTLTGFVDWATEDRGVMDYHNGVKCDRYKSSNFKVERGATTTTVVICSGILKRL